MLDLPGLVVATLLTVAVFSHVWRRNIFSRAAQYLVLGTLSGYVAAVVLRMVLFPGLFRPLFTSPAKHLPLLIPLLLILLLALRFLPWSRLHDVGLLPLGLLLGVGGALALAGALRGTLVPQLMVATRLSFLPQAPSWLDALSVLAATLTTVAVVIYFRQRTLPAPASSLLHKAATLGYWMLMIAFGALLASTAGARITLLIDRLLFFETAWRRFLGG
ncbi:MAG: hypothetical protein D6775_03665 [Caldilineae bacterium]|nr:MAG: hypothetical protein D6775_03665 [Caldilineae bacterium]